MILEVHINCNLKNNNNNSSLSCQLPNLTFQFLCYFVFTVCKCITLGRLFVEDPDLRECVCGFIICGLLDVLYSTVRAFSRAHNTVINIWFHLNRKGYSGRTRSPFFWLRPAHFLWVRQCKKLLMFQFPFPTLTLVFFLSLLAVNLLVFILCQVSVITEAGLFLLGELLINSMWLSLGFLSLDLLHLPTRSWTQGTDVCLCLPTGLLEPLGFLCIE